MLSTFVASTLAASSNYTALFTEWKATHAKVYADATAEASAFRAFKENEDKIVLHNALKESSYTLGHNAFSDLTSDQFYGKYLGYNAAAPRAQATATHSYTSADLAAAQNTTAVDWVAKGAVTPVKNQGQCGSCWAFSTTGSVEGAYKIATGKLLSLSEEDLVECDTDEGDQGCQGGLMDNAFKFIEKHGLAAEAAYPYISGTGIRGLCKADKEKAAVATLTGFTDVPTGDENALLTAVAKQPVSVAIEADKSAFQVHAHARTPLPSHPITHPHLHSHTTLHPPSSSTSRACSTRRAAARSWITASYSSATATSRASSRSSRARTTGRCVHHSSQPASSISTHTAMHPSPLTHHLLPFPSVTHRSRTHGARPGARRATSVWRATRTCAASRCSRRTRRASRPRRRSRSRREC